MTTGEREREREKERAQTPGLPRSAPEQERTRKIGNYRLLLSQVNTDVVVCRCRLMVSFLAWSWCFVVLVMSFCCTKRTGSIVPCTTVLTATDAWPNAEHSTTSGTTLRHDAFQVPETRNFEHNSCLEPPVPEGNPPCFQNTDRWSVCMASGRNCYSVTDALESYLRDQSHCDSTNAPALQLIFKFLLLTKLTDCDDHCLNKKRGTIPSLAWDVPHIE